MEKKGEKEMNNIVKIELTNFRNIKHIVLDVKGKNPVIIAGDNNLGKSNILSALSWFFTNTLLTDKWGTGENDIDSIIPINQVKGEFVEVKVTFETGTEFTKVYKTQWDSRTGKPKAHTTEGLINNVASKTMFLWNEELMKEVSFTESLKGFNELRLFTDPLYALQKLKPQELRALLVALGCDVTNEEVFEALADEDTTFMKESEAKYRGNFLDMRTDYKKKIESAEKSKVVIDNQLALYNDVTPYNSIEYKKVCEELEDTRNKMYAIKDDENERLIADNKHKLEVLKSEKNIAIQKYNVEKLEKLNYLRNVLRDAKTLANQDKDKRTAELKIKLDASQRNLNNVKLNIAAYTNSLNIIKDSLVKARDSSLRMLEEQKHTVIKLEAVKKSEFADKVKCPVCSSEFVIDPTKETMFEVNKQNEITRLNNQLEKYEKNLKEAKKGFEQLKKQRVDTEEQIKSCEESKAIYEDEIKAINSQISIIQEEPVDLSKVNELEASIQNLNNEMLDTSSFDNEINDLEEKQRLLVTDSEAILAEKRLTLSMKVKELDAKKTELSIAKSNFESKKELMEKQEAVIYEINNLEKQYLVINLFIHKTIEMCNHKAYEKTGFKFVMLEETLSNTIKEVCYLTVDGVPFDSVNTSKKLLIGTVFINKIKDLLAERGVVRNSFPILCDKFESISVNTLNKEYSKGIFDKCQFITTKVTEGDITIL